MEKESLSHGQIHLRATTPQWPIAAGRTEVEGLKPAKSTREGVNSTEDQRIC